MFRIFLMMISFAIQTSSFSLTPDEDTVLRAIKNPAVSGDYSESIANRVGMTKTQVESVASSLESQGYAVVFNRGAGGNGISVTSLGLNYVFLPSLQSYKDSKVSDINEKTQALIGQGFVFNTKNFSLGSIAQGNWTGLFAAKDLLTYPVSITTSDDQEFMVTSIAEMTSFYTTALGTVKARYDSGRPLVVSVESAVDHAAVDAVVDNR